MWTVVPLEVDEGDVVRERRADLAHLRMFFVSFVDHIFIAPPPPFLVLSFVLILLAGSGRMEKGGPKYDGRIPWKVAEGCGIRSGYGGNMEKPPLLLWPLGLCVQ